MFPTLGLGFRGGPVRPVSVFVRLGRACVGSDYLRANPLSVQGLAQTGQSKKKNFFSLFISFWRWRLRNRLVPAQTLQVQLKPGYVRRLHISEHYREISAALKQSSGVFPSDIVIVCQILGGEVEQRFRELSRISRWMSDRRVRLVAHRLQIKL